jgi:cytoskeletal protein RodZ
VERVNVHISGINAGDATLTTMNGTALTSTSAESIFVNGAQVGDNGKIAIPTGTKISRNGDGYDLQIPTGSAVIVQFSRKNTSTPENTGNSDDKKVPGVPATGLATIGLTGAVMLTFLAVIFAKITKARG